VLARVGFNLLYLVPGQVGGTEVFARRLVDALARPRPEAQFTAFCGREAEAALREAGWPANVRIQPLPVAAAVKPLRIAAELSLLPAFASRARVDVLHSMGTTSPLHGASARVVTVHDLIYDHYPDAFPAPARYGLKALVPAGARRAHRVQADSQAAKDEIVELLGVPPGRVDVVHLGLGMKSVANATESGELRSRLDLPDGPVLLSVAAALPHKNLDRLIRAVAELDQTKPTLVLVGHAGRQTDELQRLAGELGIAHRVRFTGWISEEDLEGLYRLATAFVYPSLHEGFGMPVLEAMHRGIPTACADATSLPEVAGDAALLFDPHSVKAIADAVRALLEDDALRRDLARRGPPRAALFTWERTAAAAWASYELALIDRRDHHGER
jgi:glycosyltransferase involved in cell wall biosynthesis